MKKIIALALALIMVFALCACGNDAPASPAASNTNVPADPAPTAPADMPEEPAGDGVAEGEPVAPEFETVSEGVLTVATSPDYAPYEFYAIGEDGTASLAGFDIELAKYIAAELGLEIEFIPMDFDGVLMEVGLGTVDMGVAGLSPDPERAESMLFSDSYYDGGQAFITHKDNVGVFTDLESLNQAGYQIGAQVASIQEGLAQEFSADADLVSLPKVTDIIAELIGGKLDGAYVETAVAESYQKNYPELVMVCEVPYDAEGNVIGIPKGNEALLAAVNAALNKCVESGAFDDFVAQANELAEGNIHEGLLD